MNVFESAIQLLPQFIRQPLLAVGPYLTENAAEIRLRSGRPVVIHTIDGKTIVPALSCGPAQLTHERLKECFLALCRYSVPLYEKCFSVGYIPLPDGHRAGVCGCAHSKPDGELSVENITSINLRIARFITPPDVRALLPILQKCRGVLVCGEPASGKTTLLRAVMRLLADEGYCTAVVDERCELAPVNENGFLCAMPLQCDVFSGYPKAKGMQQAVRTMSPQYLICDEIGDESDVYAVQKAVNSGVVTIASIHAASEKELQLRPQYKVLLQTGAFDTLLFLSGRNRPGHIARTVCI